MSDNYTRNQNENGHGKGGKDSESLFKEVDN